MNRINAIKALEKRPLFTFNEFVRIIGKKPQYARIYLHRLKSRGLVFQIERGKYSVFDDPLIFSSHIMLPSYISFWTALRFYGFTEQLPVEIMIASPKPREGISFHGTKIHFFKTKHLWGYKKQRYAGFDIFVAEKEKSIIDSLLAKNTPFDEIAKAVETRDFDAKRLIEYAVKTKNKSLMKRVGYLMENFGLEPKELAGHLDNNYVLLDWNGGKKGEKSKNFKVIVNRRLNDIT